MKLQSLSQYKERVTFTQFAGVADGYAGFSDVWEDVKTVWAKVYTQSSAEAYFGGAKQSWVIYMVEIMASVTGINDKMHITWGGLDLEILSIRPDPMDENVVEITTKYQVWEGS